MAVTGTPLNTSKANATTTSTDHPNHHNAMALAINEIATALLPVRRRDTRAATNYGTGDQTFTPNTVVLNEGGITFSGSTYTVPSTGTYTITAWISVALGLGSTTMSTINMTMGGNTYRLALPLMNSALPMAVHMNMYLSAGNTIVFGINNQSGATASIAFGCHIHKMVQV